MKPVKDRINFAAKEKICKNCFSKTDLLKDCICSMKCRVDGYAKKHHTMLHLKSPYEAAVNSTNKQDLTKPDKLHTFLQVIPVTMIYVANTAVVNALLDPGSDINLITSELAKTLKLKGKQRKLSITSALSMSVSVTSKLEEFSICSTHHPDQIEVKNTQVIDSLNLPSQCISKAEIQRKWSHVKDIPIDVINKDIYILIGAYLPHLHICYNVISGNQNEHIAILTKLGWVLLGGNSSKIKMSLNHITSDHNLENLVERFWDIECNGTVNKRDSKVLPKGDKHAVDILAKTTKKENNRYSVGLLWKEDTVTLPNKRSLVISRMISLEKKFDRQPDLKRRYVKTINQYIKDAMKTDINKRNDNFNNKVNYIPHHAVTNINKFA